MIEVGLKRKEFLVTLVMSLVLAISVVLSIMDQKLKIINIIIKKLVLYKS